MEKWYIVLLPGWGKAWVHTQDAQLTRTEAAVDGVKSVELLELVSPRDPAAAAALLRLVGTNVINLHMTGFGDVPEDWWNDIFNSCREVQEVCIDGIICLPIVESLTTSRARKLERLFLRIQYITRENVAEVREILAALTDRGHPFSKQLREFGFSAGGIVFGDVIVDPDIFSQALQMLEANKTLQFFRFDLPVSVRTVAQSTALKSAFDRFQNQVLPVEANQLGVREKAAFLSVLQAEKTPVAMRELDRGVISTVLDLAPKRCYRWVNVAQPQVADAP